MSGSLTLLRSEYIYISFIFSDDRHKSIYSISQTENMTADECAKLREMELNLENERKNSYNGKKKKVKPEAMAATTWRDLIPVIKIDICTVRIFNNLKSLNN